MSKRVSRTLPPTRVFCESVRRLLKTIEFLNRAVRKCVKTKGRFFEDVPKSSEELETKRVVLGNSKYRRSTRISRGRTAREKNPHPCTERKDAPRRLPPSKGAAIGPGAGQDDALPGICLLSHASKEADGEWAHSGERSRSKPAPLENTQGCGTHCDPTSAASTQRLV